MSRTTAKSKDRIKATSSKRAPAHKPDRTVKKAPGRVKVDPLTLSVVRGVLEPTQREMPLTLEKTARSSVFNLAHDYSTALFNAKPEMILQGQDIPIHLGSLIPAAKAIVRFFGDDIREGDLILHNDPAYGGSHAIDLCMYKPVFYKGTLKYWTVCKGHLTDIGGPVPAGYNPIGACQVGERNLIAMLDKYGVPTIDACVDELLAMADRHMRSLIKSVPDGTYVGTAILEDAGHGFGDFEITATVTIKQDNCHIAIKSPPQIPYFINSYEGNSHSGVYLGLMMFAQLPPPYNEGLYRCVSLDFGPKGTLCNASEPAPHMNCTTTPMETLTDAVRLAFEKAMPSKVAASWGHANGLNIAGWDSRNDEEYVTMVLATIISGAGATPQQDGWHACGPECCFGALTSGDIELLEYSYPIIIHRYSLMTDSGGAGKFRGGSGTAWEVEPLDKEMTFITFGEGRRIPAVGAAGAKTEMIETKVGRLELNRHGQVQIIKTNVIDKLQPGESVTNMNPGGGGYGDPRERPVDKVVWDVKNGLVSIKGAKEDYGVVIKDVLSLEVDKAATARLRAAVAAQ